MRCVVCGEQRAHPREYRISGQRVWCSGSRSACTRPRRWRPPGGGKLRGKLEVRVQVGVGQARARRHCGK
jgi:hypothetical protein